MKTFPKWISVKRTVSFFVIALLLSQAGLCAAQSPAGSEKDMQAILQQSTVQPPEKAKVNDIWIETAAMTMEAKTVQASIGEYIRVVLVSPTAEDAWQLIEEKPRFLTKLHSQEIPFAAENSNGEAKTADLFLFRVEANATGQDRLTFVLYQNVDGKKQATGMVDLGVMYYNPQIRKAL